MTLPDSREEKRDRSILWSVFERIEILFFLLFDQMDLHGCWANRLTLPYIFLFFVFFIYVSISVLFCVCLVSDR